MHRRVAVPAPAYPQDHACRCDALTEHRWLRVRDGGDRSGWLVGVDRQISDHFRVDLGYNFTDFSGDLTQLDYDYQG